MIVYIIGITGVGKSSNGKRLARKLNYPFLDLDAWIEVREGKSVNELFRISEDYFRKCESNALKSIGHYKRLVVATGGGIVVRPENIEFMRRTGFVIHLYRPVKQIAGLINTKRRPLLQKNPYILFELYHKRKALYQAARHVKIDCRNKSRALNDMIEEVKKRENKSYKRS